jgi:hypothetical protein
MSSLTITLTRQFTRFAKRALVEDYLSFGGEQILRRDPEAVVHPHRQAQWRGPHVEAGRRRSWRTPSDGG